MQSRAGRDQLGTWGQQPDPLLERVMARARILLAAEKTALGMKAENAKAEVATALTVDQRRMIDDLKLACAAHCSRIASDAERLAELQSLLSSSQRTSTELRNQLDATLRSTSWTVTAPLRAFRRLFGS